MKDMCTDLANTKALANMCASLDRARRPIVMLININNFKDINAIYGRDTGDAYLRYLAKILKSLCDDYPIFRVGGDEFCIVFEGFTRAQANEFSEQLDDKILAYSDWPGKSIRCRYSFSEFTPSMTIDKLLIRLGKKPLNDGKDLPPAKQIMPLELSEASTVVITKE